MITEENELKAGLTPFTDTFEQIYSLYGNKVYNLAYRITGNPETAEDITQEAFIRVITSFDQFRGESTLFTWIFKITQNIAFRYSRKTKRQSFRSMEELIEKASRTVYDEKYDEVEKQLLIGQVKDGCLLGLLRCLSFHQRMAFILNVLFNLSIHDVAAIIEKSEEATRILVCRARNNLKEFLCKNCSLYDFNNPCKCENLIAFSLKQGWINKFNPTIPPEAVEAELKEFKDEIGLFKSISSRKESSDFRTKVLHSIKEKGLNIFSKQKVK